jgi:hypothetical protein
VEGNFNNDSAEIAHSQRLKAGKRTYFFDVKPTRGNDYYLTITESTKRRRKDGSFFYEKHKIFLYKEDFHTFLDALQQSIDYVKEQLPDAEFRRKTYEEIEGNEEGDFSSESDADLKWE